MQTSDDGNITGGCYCGGVRFAIAAGTLPFAAGYCHCRDCRQAHAAPLYQYVYVEVPAFRIVAGEQLLKFFTRTPSSTCIRYFCERCGSKVYNRFRRVAADGTSIDLRGTFPSLFDDQGIAMSQTWSPQKHLFCAESIMDLSLIQDGLPRHG